MTPEERVKLRTDPDGWLLCSRGLYWRPMSAGYTGIKDEAGRYDLEDATKTVMASSGECSMIHESDAPEYSKNCCSERRRNHMEAQITRLRTALSEAEARLTKAREALRPFAIDATENIDNGVMDSRYIRTLHSPEIQVIHLRRAATALKEITDPL